MTTAQRPLDGLRIVSLAEQYPGPFATLILGDLGADVIQVERPAGGDPSRAFPGFYAALNRGKRSVALDLKTSVGLAACRRLIASADALIEGFRPGVMAKLGLGPDDLLASHETLVYVSISGFGQTGPLRDHPAHDLSFQALAGLLDSPSDEPVVPALSLADLCAGVFAAIAALTGLMGRQQSGRGGHFDVAMFDTLITFMASRLVPLANGRPADTLGLDPGYGLYPTADGRWISLSIAFEDHFWRAMCDVMDLTQFRDLTAAQRVEQRAALRAALADRIAVHPADFWDSALSTAGVPYGPVLKLDQLLDNDNIAARHLIQSVDTPHGSELFVRQPIVVDSMALGPRSGAPDLGEHTAAVLAECGLSQNDVDELARPRANRDILTE
jgi:crotonobetainyl-CoA:carnitine CoA-transferase CaiB-like acyl-CoA transferase